MKLSNYPPLAGFIRKSLDLSRAERELIRVPWHRVSKVLDMTWYLNNFGGSGGLHFHWFLSYIIVLCANDQISNECHVNPHLPGVGSYREIESANRVKCYFPPLFQVSWLRRHSDTPHLLTFGLTTYSNDARIQVRVTWGILRKIGGKVC